jgi:hypothetical protein
MEGSSLKRLTTPCRAPKIVNNRSIKNPAEKNENLINFTGNNASV